MQFTACGLWFDLIGVLLLGRSFFWKKPDTIKAEARARYGGNMALERNLFETNLDGRWGTVFLCIGFALQILGYLKFSYIDCFQTMIVILGYVVLIALTLFYLGWWRNRRLDELVPPIKSE